MTELRPDEMTIPSLVSRKAEEFGSKSLITFDNFAMSFREFDESTNIFGNSLLDMGMAKGDKVAIVVGNRPWYQTMWVGLAKVGGIEVPIDFELKGDMLQYRINNSDATRLITEVANLQKIIPIADRLPNIREIFIHPDITDEAEPLKERFILHRYSDLTKGSRKNPNVDVKPWDIFAMTYTSGTTGRAKGALSPNAQWVYVTQERKRIVGTTPADVIFNVYPTHNGTAQCETFLSALAAGAGWASVERFSASKFWDQVRKFGVTEIVYMGGILTMLLKQPERLDDRDHPCRKAWGSACPVSVWEKFEKRFNVKILEMYGQIEAWPITQLPMDAPRSKIGSMGLPGTKFEVKIFDENDMEVGPRVTGQIVLRTKMSHIRMAGYYKEPERTVEGMSNLWWHTGDLGYYDEDGYFYFVGRKKEALRLKGRISLLSEIEEAINKHPKIQECVAFGVTSELATGEQDLKVIAVVKPKEEMVPEELLDHCQLHLPYYMVPRYVELTHAELEKTHSMRVARWKYEALGAGGAWDRQKTSYVVKR